MQKSNTSSGLYRASSLTSFTFGLGDEEKRPSSRSSSSERMRRSLSPKNSFVKGVSTQTPHDIPRTTSAATTTKRKSSDIFVSTGRVSRPSSDERRTPVGVSASRITEKKFYSTSSTEPSEHHHIQHHHQQRPYSPDDRRHKDKSQMVTYSSILQANRQQQLLNQTAHTTTSITDITKVFERKKKCFILSILYEFLF